MVMHPSPGHYSGTLVNALLHHCRLPALRLEALAAAEGEGEALLGATPAVDAEDGEEEGLLDGDWDEDDLGGCGGPGAASGPPAGLGGLASAAAAGGLLPGGAATTIRPGIVHRLDKGTTGLVVVAKTDAALASLSNQVRGAERSAAPPRACTSPPGCRGCSSPLTRGALSALWQLPQAPVSSSPRLPLLAPY